VGHDALRLDAMGLDIEEPNVLDFESMEPNSELDVLEFDCMESDTGQRSCAEICLSRHFFLALRSLSFEKGAPGSDMPA
jgi:hypothetical protein